jgi:REP element-mobilizing transposase RayT
MSQIHTEQQGTFHVTTNAKERVPWCTHKDIPNILIDNLCMTRSLQKAELFAFCILPNHMHIIVRPGEKGLSAFMHSFKRNAMRDIRSSLPRSGRSRSSATETDAFVDCPHWQKGFHDERIRDDAQRSDALSYVTCNAFKHGLVDDLLHGPGPHSTLSTCLILWNYGLIKLFWKPCTSLTHSRQKSKLHRPFASASIPISGNSPRAFPRIPKGS